MNASIAQATSDTNSARAVVHTRNADIQEAELTEEDFHGLKVTPPPIPFNKAHRDEEVSPP